MPEPVEQPISRFGDTVDDGGRPGGRTTFQGTQRDRNQLFGSNERDTSFDVRDCDESRAPYADRGPHVAHGLSAPEGKYERSEIRQDNNPQPTEASRVPEHTFRSWEEQATGRFNNSQLAGAKPVNPQKQKATSSKARSELQE